MEERHGAVADILCLANRLSREIDALAVGCADGALSGINARMLAWLNARGEDEICQRDIEEAFAIRRSTVSRVLRLMERKGLIVRESVEGDARLKRVRLTDEARRICAASCDGLASFEARATGALSDGEIRQLRALLGKIDGSVER